MTARQQRADTTPSPMDRRRLHFSAPVAASIVAVVAVAVVAAMLLFGPRGLFGIGLGPSPTALPNVEPTPTVDPSSLATVEPTAVPTVRPTPTVEPTPTPVAAWTGLEWSEPITPSIFVADALWWNDRYVGAGYVVPEEQPASDMPEHVPVFLQSYDGLTWDVVQEGDSYAVGDAGGGPYPAKVVPVGDRLLAMGAYTWGGGPPALWESSDGRSWTEIDSSTWRPAWSRAHVIDIAGGPAGALAVGAVGSGCCLNPDHEPIVLYSPDGLSWEHVTSLAPFPAMVRDVASFSDGFVIAGRAGERDGTEDDWGYIGTGVAAAWTSTDGRTWTAASLEGVEPVRGGRLREIAVGVDGLFAIGNAQPVAQYSDAVLTGWSSSDGRVWTRLGELGEELPGVRVLTSDGTRMVILGPEASSMVTLTGWTSIDGARWTPLQFSGAPAPAADLPHGPVAGVSGALKYQLPSEWPPTRLLRDGVVAYGWVPLGSTWEDGTAAAAWVARALAGD